MNFAEWLRQYMAPKESCQAFADRIRAKRNTIRHLLKNKDQKPSLETMLQIAYGLADKGLTLTDVCDAVQGHGKKHEQDPEKPQAVKTASNDRPRREAVDLLG